MLAPSLGVLCVVSPSAPAAFTTAVSAAALSAAALSTSIAAALTSAEASFCNAAGLSTPATYAHAVHDHHASPAG